MRMVTPYFTNRRFASDLFDEMDRFLDSWNRTSTSRIYDERAYDVTESHDGYLMSVDLPGMKQEDIKIEMANDTLTVSGERRRENQEKPYAFFKRSFTLPNSVDVDKIEASYVNGVLELYLPKTQAAKPRTIQIQSGKSGFFDKLLGSKKQNQELKEVNSTKVS